MGRPTLPPNLQQAPVQPPGVDTIATRAEWFEWWLEAFSTPECGTWQTADARLKVPYRLERDRIAGISVMTEVWHALCGSPRIPDSRPAN